jgi:putative ABC transport system permease protein
MTVPSRGGDPAIPPGLPASGLSVASRIRRFLVGEAGPGPAAALAVIALLAAFLATAGPREITSLQNKALRQTLAQQTGGFGITATSSPPDIGPSAALSAHQIQVMSDVMAGYVRPPLVSPAAQRWAGLTAPLLGVLNPEPQVVLSEPPRLEIVYRSALTGNARLVSGTLPRSATVGNGSTGPVTLQAAITAATAKTFGLRLGSLVRLGRAATMPASDPPIVLSITGVLRPADPASTFWTTDPLVAAPYLQNPTHHPVWLGAVLIGPDELSALQDAVTGTSTEISWDFPLDSSGLTASQAPGMLAAMTTVTSGNAGEAALQAVQVVQAGPLGGFSSPQSAPTLTAIGAGVLSAFIAGQAAVGTTDALLLAGVAAAMVILLLIGAAAVAEAFGGELVLSRARGGSAGQVAGRVLGATAGAAGPALVVGVVVGVVVVPGGGNTASWVLAALAAVVALGAPALLAAWQHRGLRSLAGAGRGDVVVPRRSARRLVIESTALVVIVGGVVALRVRGLAPGAGVDPYLVCAPVLIAVAAGLVAARVYPVPLRALARVTAARRGAVGFLGIARSARARSVPLLPALALVVAMAVIALGGMVRAAVTSGQIAASWQQVGADAVVDAAGGSLSIGPAAQAAIAAAPGVAHASAVYLMDAGAAQAGNLLVGATGTVTTGVVIVDPAQYAALVADTPWPAFPARLLAPPPPGQRGSPVPVIASPAMAADIRAGSRQLAFDGADLPLRVAATASSTPALPGGGPFVILPAWVVSRLTGGAEPNTMLLAGAHINIRALGAVVARALPGGIITSRAAALQADAGTPAVHGSDLALEQAAGAAAACAAAAVLLGVLLTGQDRTRLGVWLTAMGMTARQARRLALLDTLPLLLVAILGGELASLAIGPLIGPGLDLSAFTGSSAPVTLRPDLVALTAPAAGALILITMAAAGQNALIRHRAGTVLRLDEDR